MPHENTEAVASVSPCGNMLAVTSDGVTATIPLDVFRQLDAKDRYRVAEFLTIQDLAAAAVARLVAECDMYDEPEDSEARLKVLAGVMQQFAVQPFQALSALNDQAKAACHNQSLYHMLMDDTRRPNGMSNWFEEWCNERGIHSPMLVLGQPPLKEWITIKEELRQVILKFGEQFDSVHPTDLEPMIERLGDKEFVAPQTEDDAT